MSLVSVVIPSHRGERYLPHALASVGDQSHSEWEVLVVDDHPAAPAAGLVRSFARTVGDRRVEYLRGSVRGPAAARNLGLAAARGDYLAFLDEDDVWHPDHLATAAAALAESHADLAFSAVEMFDDETGRPLGRWGPTPEERARFPIGLYLRNYIAVLSVVMHRRVIGHHGVFDPAPQLIYGEDHDYWVRLAFAGVRFVEVVGVHGRYRKGHPSGTSDPCALQEVHCHVYRRHLAGALARCTDPCDIRRTVAGRHAELAQRLARRRRGRALRHAAWALWISPTKGRMVRSAVRRAVVALVERR